MLRIVAWGLHLSEAWDLLRWHCGLELGTAWSKCDGLGLVMKYFNFGKSWGEREPQREDIALGCLSIKKQKEVILLCCNFTKKHLTNHLQNPKNRAF